VQLFTKGTEHEGAGAASVRRPGSRARPVRPRARARRLRRGLRGGHQGSQVPRDRPAGPAGADQPPAPRRLRLRAEHGRRCRHPAPGPRQVPPQAVRPARHPPAWPEGLRRGLRVPAAQRRAAREGPGADGLDRGRGRPAAARLARHPHRRPAARRQRRQRRAAHQARVHRPRGGARRRAFRAQALRHPQAHRARRGGDGLLRETADLHPEPQQQYAHLQGHAVGRPDRVDVPRPARSRHGVGAGPGAPALQHQHLPVVAARPPLPLRRAQRRDQYAARQHQLDARARGAVPVRRPGRRPGQGAARHARRAVGLGHLRQRARVPRHERPLAAARDPHDDPRALAASRVHEPGAARVL